MSSYNAGGFLSNSLMKRRKDGFTGKHFSYASPSFLEQRISRVSFKGYLQSQRRRNPMDDPEEKDWSQCFFCLQDDTMYKYDNATDAEVSDALSASSFDSEREEKDKALHLQSVVSVRVHGVIHNCFSIRTAECTTWYRADDKDSCNAWVHSIYRAISDVFTAHKRRCASFDSTSGTTPSPDFKSPLRSSINEFESPTMVLSMPPLARKRTLKRSPSQAVRRAHRRGRNKKISVPIDSKNKSSSIKLSSTAPATMSTFMSQNRSSPYQRTVSDPKPSKARPVPGAFERTRSSGARYVPPHRRGRNDFTPESVSSSGDEYESNLSTTPPALMVASGSKSPVPMFQLDDTFSTPPASPGLMKFEEEQQRSPLHIGTRVRNERMFMNTSLSDLGNEEDEEKEEENNRSSHVLSDFGCTADQGKRDKMEDRHVAILDLNKHLGLSSSKEEEFQSFFGVYDGHSGYEAAEYAAKHIHELLVKEENFVSDTLKAFVQCFLRADKNYFNKRNLDIENGVKPCYAGTTALSVLFRGHRCFVATLGDSLAVLCRDGKAVAISEKCTPGTKSERERIEKAGGWVTEEKEFFVSRLHHIRMDIDIVRKYAEDSMRWLITHRVNGELGVSRAIGDPDYKGEGMSEYPWGFNKDHPERTFTADLVIAEPIVKEFEIKEEDDFLLLACDGLWDVITLEDAVEAVSKWLQTGLSAQETSRKLASLALMLGSPDNITIVIVCF